MSSAAARAPFARACGLAVLLLAWSAFGAAAQTTHSTPSAFSGFSQNKKEPIKIESMSLEVRDKEKMATFIDNVRLVQGDTTLECKRLTVFYDDEMAPGGGNVKKGKSSPDPGAGAGGQQVKRLEAKGGVVITQKDQTATGDTGVYDMKTNSMVLTGNVVMTQGTNVVTGDKLYVDMTTGVSRVESRPSAAGGQQAPSVRALINPNSTRESPKPPGGASAADASSAKTSSASPDRTNSSIPERTTGSGSDKDKPKQGASRPLKLN
jgi:lipopolysaccharide export system protein LptA